MANKEEIIKKLKDAVFDYDVIATKEAAKEALDAGIDTQEAITEGLAKGLLDLGELFEKEIFCSELLLAGDAFQQGFEILKDKLTEDNKEEKKGVVILGVVEGDIHDIGKDFVKMLLTAKGFEVHDLGYDISIEKFIEAVKEKKADILALSALMSSTMLNMKEVIKEVRKQNLDVKIMIGGGPITAEVCEKYGADAWSIYATDAPDKALSLLKK